MNKSVGEQVERAMYKSVSLIGEPRTNQKNPQPRESTEQGVALELGDTGPLKRHRENLGEIAASDCLLEI